MFEPNVWNRTCALFVVGIGNNNNGDVPMFTKTKLALAAALVLGAASAVQANDNDRNDTGGYRVGPLGQHFQGANPVYHRSMWRGRYDYAYVPGFRFRHQPRWMWDWE
jgi:hypothetical protein